MGNNQGNKETWATKVSAWSTVTVAVATVFVAAATGVLVYVTWQYVSHTHKQVDIQKDLLEKKDVEIDIQKQQFQLANRAKIYPKFPNALEGEIYGGAILVVNMGNLSAEDFKLVWKVTKIDGGGEREEGEGELLRKKVKPEEIIEIPYKSYFKDKDEVIVLVTAWKYKGQGIEDYVIKDSSYLWDIYQKPKSTWVYPYGLGYDHIKTIISIKNELREYLQQEDNK